MNDNTTIQTIFFFAAAVGFEPTISTLQVLPFTTKVRGLGRDSYPSSRPPGWPIGFRVFQANA